MMFVLAIFTTYKFKRELTNNDKYRTGLVFMEKNKDDEEL